MVMINSHYVPMQTLKRFGEKLCLFNVQTGEYKENVKLTKSYSELGFYSPEVEEKLNRRIESQFGNLFNNKLYNAIDKIELTRDELRLVKKFLLISVIRSYGNENFLQNEKIYYKTLQEYTDNFSKLNNLPKENIEPPFIEKQINNETPFEYWMRTLEVILDSDGTPQDILKQENKTYPAYRWAEVINNGYVAFWDSEFKHDEFVITDIGMTSENEKGWNGTTVHNVKKTNFLMNLLEHEKNKTMQKVIAKSSYLHRNFSENFMMFPISSKRMIVEIDPFYKFRIAYKDYYDMPSLEELTMLSNEKLYYPNEAKYILPQNGIEPNYHKDDKYIYEIKHLTSKETRYCNELFLDRINTWLGFSSLEKIVGSVVAYYRDNKFPYAPRTDFYELYELINKKYDSSIDLNNIARVRK